MELLDSDACCRCRGVDIADERLVLEHPGDTVLRPQRRRQPLAVRVDQEEFDFVADYRVDAGISKRGLDPAQCSSAAGGDRCAVLLEEPGGRPRQPVADDAQGGQIDAETLIADHTDVCGECNTALVDTEGMPHRTGAEARIGECVGPAYRHGLGLGESGGVHDGADDGVDALCLQLGDRGRGKRCGCHGSHSAARISSRGYARQASLRCSRELA
ncbi:Uncharacterised protein [Mycobacterium tuberculosis]|uniref:Uncharacterized protein n=1 Tax=Mycobacterium tuberculosis TaxID=1773 RepID=A0A655ES69_MYCTX|nr:Uncharacterised protein [Mycobacterium tuberculosis]CKT25733.1 Uncharacterised protein [Mycobacterium tuberculosis]CKT35982.1 Uncharacterised protein [Mycobacterium tuberculosis]CNT79536.1 Uncharacterised protein [Mycobacterium tuberculosis]CNU12337.1 Uncharacterised protein [Mycobacterium tuberculosis]